MSDDRLRAAERAWRETGDVEAEARLLRELVRAGRLTPGGVGLSAALGHAPARAALEEPPPAEPPDPRADPEAWATHAAEALCAPREGVDATLAAARACVAAAFWTPVFSYAHDARFDGLDDGWVRVLDVLEEVVLRLERDRDPATACEVIEAALGEVADEAHGWFAGLNVVTDLRAILHEPENRQGLLARTLASFAMQLRGDDARPVLRDEVGPWLLGLEDPVAARRARFGRRFGAERDLVRAVSVSPDGALVVTANRVGEVALRDAATGATRWRSRRRPSDAFAAAFTPDGRHVVSCDLHGEVLVWSAATGDLVRAFAAHDQGVTAVVPLADGRLVTAGYDGLVKVWATTAEPGGEPAATLRGHERGVGSLAVTPDGRRAASRGSDERLVLWDLEAAAAAWSVALRGGEVAFLPGGDLLSVADDGVPRRLDAATGVERRAGAKVGTIHALAVSPDGARALLARSDAITLLDTRTLATAHEWSARGVQLSAAFAPDGRRALVGARSGGIRSFEVP
jgi:hypothetical protein